MRNASPLLLLLCSACIPDGTLEGQLGPPPSGDAGGSADADVLEADADTPDVRPVASCGDDVCAADESCESCPADCGECPCDPGFTIFQARCAPRAPLPFIERRADDVCARWNRDFVSTPGSEWAPSAGGNDPCDPGVVSEDAYANALRRTNLYRWLGGLGPIVEDPSRREMQQACATVLFNVGSLTHTPPMSTPCWTEAGFDGASSSNIARSSGSLASTVDLYMGDQGVASLGHRRWIMNPPMVETTFGLRPPFSCMYAFSRGDNDPSDVLAYPPPGYVPARAAAGEWSFRMESIDFVAADTRVEMAIDDGEFQTVDARVEGGGFGAGPILVWRAPPGTWRAGTVARVRLSNAAGRFYTYTVVFIAC